MNNTVLSMREGESRQAELTAQLKGWSKTISDLSTRRAELTGFCYAGAYEWIQISMIRQQAKSIQDGCKRLAATIGIKTAKGVDGWYCAGKFMFDHGLEAGRTNSSATRALYDVFNLLSKSEQLRAIQVVKGGGSRDDVRKITKKSTRVQLIQAKNRAEAFARDGKLTLQRIRLEMRVVQTMARKFYGTDNVLVQIVKDARVQEVV